MSEELVGLRVWFPVEWEEGTLDSFLTGADGEILCYVIRRDNGRLFTVDMQMREVIDE